VFHRCHRLPTRTVLWIPIEIINDQNTFFMPLPGHTGRRRHYVPTCPSVRSFVCYQICEHYFEKNEPLLLSIGTSGSRGRGIKRSTLGSGGRRSRSYEAEYRFGGLSEASFSTILGRVAFQFNSVWGLIKYDSPTWLLSKTFKCFNYYLMVICWKVN